jgi:uncharacterized spore protein YtfJ
LGRASGFVGLSHSGWEGDACGAERAAGGGTGGGANHEALAVLELGLGMVSSSLWKIGRVANRCLAVRKVCSTVQ